MTRLPDRQFEARRVFIVEDEPLLAMQLADMLTELGHRVIATATRIQKALSIAECGEFNLAVLDINLAGSNTFQVAAILQKRGIPFLFTSGYGAEGLIEGYRAGQLLTKPFGVSELKRMIAQIHSADVP